jgi:hypothetical protein
VLPGFKEHEAERERKKLERMAPALEKAMARKAWMKALADDEIPVLQALGRQIVQQMPKEQRAQAATFQGSSGLTVPLEDPNQR